MEGEKKSDSLLLSPTLSVLSHFSARLNFDFCSEESELFWSEQQEEICDAMEHDSQGGAPSYQK